MNKHFKLLFVSLVAACALIYAGKVYAVQVSSDYIPLTTVPGIFKEGIKTNPVAVLKSLYGFAIGIGSVIGVVMIMYAGFEYMYKESITGKSDAKQRIWNVFLGLAVILGSYILLKTINPALVNFDVRLPGGDGRVAHLSVAENASDEARSLTREALSESNQIHAEIDKLQKEIDEIEGDIGNGVVPDPETMEKLDGLKAQINTKKTQDILVRSKAEASMVPAILDENIYLRAAGLAPSEDSLQGKQANAMQFFDKQLAELRTFDQNNADVKKAIQQVTARKEAVKEEFNQQVYVSKILIDYKGVPSDQAKSLATSVITDIKGDITTQSAKLRAAGLDSEAREYAARGQTRIDSLCGADLCVK